MSSNDIKVGSNIEVDGAPWRVLGNYVFFFFALILFTFLFFLYNILFSFYYISGWCRVSACQTRKGGGICEDQDA